MELAQIILEAVGRGWCAETNRTKEMDSDLALAISDEVVKAVRAIGPSISLDASDLKRALMFAAPDDTPEQLQTPVTIKYFKDGHSGDGYYVYCTEYPDEGCEMISDKTA